MDRDQRIQASRIVYYLITSTLILVSARTTTIIAANEVTVSDPSLLRRSHNDETCVQHGKAGRDSSKCNRPDPGFISRSSSI